MKSFVKGEAKEVRGIIGRIRRRDFSGNAGLVIKNSIFSFATSLVSKIGGLFFTVILARLLLPEAFGLYSLALSTILLFCVFSDLGVSSALIKFISSSVHQKKSKAYFYYLFKIKMILSALAVILLLSSAYFISNYYYQKPIFYALLAGAVYIIFSSIYGVFSSIFPSINNFKVGFFQEIIFQISRIALVSLSILFFISKVYEESLVIIVILMLSLSYVLVFLFVFIVARRKVKFFKAEKGTLSDKEKKAITRLILSLSLLSVSGIFFGYIDIIVLGRFVSSEFIGYYRAAFSLFASAAPLITFSGVLFPIFNRLKGKKLEKGFRKSRRITFLLGLAVMGVTFFLATPIILILFGESYSPSIVMLQVLSLLLFMSPIIALYEAYFISQNKIKILARLLIWSTLLNIMLNILFVIWLIKYGELQAVMGVCVATIFSRGFYLAGLGIYKLRVGTKNF